MKITKWVNLVSINLIFFLILFAPLTLWAEGGLEDRVGTLPETIIPPQVLVLSGETAQKEETITSVDIEDEPGAETSTTASSAATAEPTADDPNAGRSTSRQSAFETSLENLLPITPEQVEIYRQKADGRDRALSDPPPAALMTKTICVTLEPGFIPPVVKLTPNLVSTMIIVDQFGYPWPITTATLGSGDLFGAQVLATETKNQVIVVPKSTHGNSNLILTLAGQDIPLMIRLETESGINRLRETDGMVVFQIGQRGPNAPPPAIKFQVEGPVSGILYTVLDGILPKGATIMNPSPKVEDTTFYSFGENIYIRTKLKLMWPSHTAVVSGIGGTNVYELPFVSSVLISKDGEV
ncbi:MAG: DotH/IcmK family type IV secretion protein, partial [Candidatus Adiutrix sp.]